MLRAGAASFRGRLVGSGRGGKVGGGGRAYDDRVARGVYADSGRAVDPRPAQEVTYSSWRDSRSD